MRRKITLYIADQLVDLDDQSLILFNYTMDDLSNPTVVRNSFSQQITLPGTPNNNRLFGDVFRLDRQVYNGSLQGGVFFNPSQKTPFTIYNEMNEVIESGYVKLDSVSGGKVPEYKVQLFGGLGSFFYSLSYDEQGNKRSLASLQYLGDSPTELDFTINAATVRAAWDTVQDGVIDDKWKVLNFIPAYEGIPNGNFSPDKALVVPSDVGLADQVVVGGITYKVKDGYSLVNLAQPQDQWSVKDLRSYLQRPCISMRAIWEAICNPTNNGGYTVDKSAIDTDEYADLWVTLPLIPSLGTLKQSTGDLTLQPSSSGLGGNAIGRYDIVGVVPAGTSVTANICIREAFQTPPEADGELMLDLYASKSVTIDGEDFIYEKQQVIFTQVLAYASDDTLVGGSGVQVNGQLGFNTPSDMASLCGFTPAWATDDFTYANQSQCPRIGTNTFEVDLDQTFTVNAVNAAYYKVMVYAYEIDTWSRIGSHPASGFTIIGDGTTALPTLYLDYDTEYAATGSWSNAGTTANSVTYQSGDSLRSNALVTKAMLLSSSATPAEYILSFCKIFGLYFIYNGQEKTVKVVPRNDLFIDETIDLTKRVDLSKVPEITPLAFDAKWYQFDTESVGGSFSDEYQKIMGIPYGAMRVNTGFDFNADTKQLLDSVVFKNAVTVLDRSKYWNYIITGGNFTPSPFIDKGNRYTLWSDAGETQTMDISCPPDSASVTYYNVNNPGYDINAARKLQLHDAEKKPVSDGANILVVRGADVTYPHFKISDDVAAMDTLNDGVPCWLLAPGSSAGISVPVYSRYLFQGDVVDLSLDFGVPKELDIPAIGYPETVTVYSKRWRAYLTDKFDVNTKVMTCRVNFAGMHVDQELLRKFYWYGNSLWVLNKIKNYSLTTFDPVECEFVQVQDKDNYLTGQN